jgi:predicted dithiol-disulfide oxidoreductase (DUF899 family)
MSETMQTTRFPGESAAYREARERLLQSERALRRQVEQVAAERRALPPGGPLPQDYVFHEGDDGRAVSFSDLFGRHGTLLVYSYMFGPSMKQPCASCTSILDALDGQVAHVTQRAALVAVAQSPIARILGFARPRGWRNLRLLSAAGTTYQRDYLGEGETGDQFPMLNVFRRDGGLIRHVWGTELLFAPPEPGQDPRHADAVWPLWNLLDLTPEGRGAFRPSLTY